MLQQTNNKKKIAIPLEQGLLSAHFGHCKEFFIAEVDTSSATIIQTMKLCKLLVCHSKSGKIATIIIIAPD